MKNGSENVEIKDNDKTVEIDVDNTKKKKRKKKRSKSYLIFRKFGCTRSEGDNSTDADGSFEVEAAGHGKIHSPSHLVIMVNGLVGSAQNWRYAAKQLVKAYPQDVIVHCSASNYNMLTFDGVDVMGTRLADEVTSVIGRFPNLQKISFVGHSLGGMIARYAIARLYMNSKQVSEENGGCRVDESNDLCLKDESSGKIAGLQPMNFITSATPHLGSRGHKQVPMFCGFYTLEKVALNTSWFFGRTGKHLYLIDSNDGKAPLLLQMASDSEDLKFISALRSFNRRVAYANVRNIIHDGQTTILELVGWSTSSLRRRHELPKCHNLSRSDKYPHVMNVEKAETSSLQDDISAEAILNKGKSADMEEAMIRGLTSMSWERVDVNFKGSKQRFLAHTTIQVKTKFLNSDGADVIQHMVDNFVL